LFLNEKPRKIGVFTGARSEYWLLKPLISGIDRDDSLELILIVSSMHLSPEFGMTCRVIENDGFRIAEKIETLLSSDSPTGAGKAVGLGLIGYSEALERQKPDMMILLGDRYETLAMAIACVLHNIPVSHIHGGELTIGAWDDAFRHSITKMSTLHFACADEYAKRIVQMGECPDRVFNVGALGVEAVTKVRCLTKKQFYELAGFSLDEVFFLVTFHPVTSEPDYGISGFHELTDALADEKFSNYRIIFTKANSDAGGRLINSFIDQYVNDYPERAVSFDAMGQVNYLSAMRFACVMAGNSSSGILEAPCFKLPVVNIGTRQDGRLRADNVIDCSPDRNLIVNALEKALAPEFRARLENMKNPFYRASTSRAIKDMIKNYDLSTAGVKNFFDLDFDFPEGYMKGER